MAMEGAPLQVLVATEGGSQDASRQGSTKLSDKRGERGKSSGAVAHRTPSAGPTLNRGQPGEFPPLPTISAGLRGLPRRPVERAAPPPGMVALPAPPQEIPGDAAGPGDEGSPRQPQRATTVRGASPPDRVAASETQGVAVVPRGSTTVLAPFGSSAACIAASLGLFGGISVEADATGVTVVAEGRISSYPPARFVAASMDVGTSWRRFKSALAAARNAGIRHRRMIREYSCHNRVANASREAGDLDGARRTRAKAECAARSASAARIDGRRFARAAASALRQTHDALRRRDDAAAAVSRASDTTDAWAIVESARERISARQGMDA
jgi:hypothetical protein